MATILPFTPAPQARPTSNGHGPAAIVFFPGVRYERGKEADTGGSRTPSSPDGNKPGRSRH